MNKWLDQYDDGGPGPKKVKVDLGTVTKTLPITSEEYRKLYPNLMTQGVDPQTGRSTWYGVPMDEIVVEDEAPQHLKDLRKFKEDYINKDKNIWRHWYDKLGYDRKNVEGRAERHAYDKVAKDLLDKGVDNLTPGQLNLISKSSYANKLDPSVWENFAQGVKDLNNPDANAFGVLGNILSPFTYPVNLVRGAMTGDLVAGLKGEPTNEYFRTDNMPAGYNPEEFAIANTAMTLGTDPLMYTGEEIFNGIGQGFNKGRETLRKGIEGTGYRGLGTIGKNVADYFKYGHNYKNIRNYVDNGFPEAITTPTVTNYFNPATGRMEIYQYDLADRLIPTRPLADVKPKFANLRRDIGMPYGEYLLGKYIPGAGRRLTTVRDRGITIDPTTGHLFDSNTREWMNLTFGKPSPILEHPVDVLGKSYGTKIGEVADDGTLLFSKKQGGSVKWLDQYDNGGQTCDEGYYWNGTQCVPNISFPFPADSYRQKNASEKDIADYNAYVSGDKKNKVVFYDTHDLVTNADGTSSWAPKPDVNYYEAIKGSPLGQFVYKSTPKGMGDKMTITDQFGNNYNDYTGLEMGYSPHNIWASPTTGIGFYKQGSDPGNILSQTDLSQNPNELPTIYFLGPNGEVVTGPTEAWKFRDEGKFNYSLGESLEGSNLSKNYSALNLFDAFADNPELQQKYKETFGYGDDLVRVVDPSKYTIQGALQLTPQIMEYLTAKEKEFPNSQNPRDMGLYTEEALNYEKLVKEYLLQQAGIDPAVGMNYLMHYNMTSPEVYSEINNPSVTNYYNQVQQINQKFPGLDPNAVIADPTLQESLNNYLKEINYKNKLGGSNKWLDRYDEGGSPCRDGYEWDPKLKDCVKIINDRYEFKKAKQAYADSLSLYNSTIDLTNAINAYNSNSSLSGWDRNTEAEYNAAKEALYRITELEANNLRHRKPTPILIDFSGKPGGYSPVSTLSRSSDNIRPVSETMMTSPLGMWSDLQPWRVLKYKKPTQPVKFKPLEEPTHMTGKKVTRISTPERQVNMQPSNLVNLSDIPDKLLSWDQIKTKYESAGYKNVREMKEMTNNLEGEGNLKRVGIYYDKPSLDNPRITYPAQIRFENKLGGAAKWLDNYNPGGPVIPNMPQKNKKGGQKSAAVQYYDYIRYK